MHALAVPTPPARAAAVQDGFDPLKPALPPGLSLLDELPWLPLADGLLLGRIQAHSHLHLAGLCDRIAGRPGRADRLDGLPAGHVHTSDPDGAARIASGRSPWALSLLAMVFAGSAQAHHRAGTQSREALCGAWADLFQARWEAQSRQALADEQAFLREDGRVLPAQRDRGVNDLIALLGAVDGILCAQATADADCFAAQALVGHGPTPRRQVGETVLKAYRWQHIVSGVMAPRVQELLCATIDRAQAARIVQALRPLAYAVPAKPSRGPSAMH